MYLTFFSYPQTAKLLVTAYSNDSKPELEGLHFIQVVTVWHTKQPQNIEAAASKVRKKIVSLCMTTKKKNAHMPMPIPIIQKPQIVSVESNFGTSK